MKKYFLLLFALSSLSLSAKKDVQWQELESSTQKARLIIMADMGNEPDEQQQMMHLLMYANEVDIEGLIAVTGKYLGPHMRDKHRQVLHPELFEELIEGYSKVYKNLILHKADYPTPDYLRAVIASGQTGYGSEAVGEGLSSEGSCLMIKAFEKEDARPIVIVVNAGSNTLAQALMDYQIKHGQKKLNELVKKLRVVENGAQDDSGAYICNKYPEIYWVRSNYQAYCYGGPVGNSRINDGTDNHKNQMGPHTWQPYAYNATGQHQWALEHIIGNHSIFGSYYPLRVFGNGSLGFIEGGGTVPWLCTINRGLSDVNNFHWGGWSGRYQKQKRENYLSKHQSVNKDEIRYQPFLMFGEGSDNWTDPETGDKYENIYTPVWRWRRAFFNDFKCRMDWCRYAFEKANHNPTAVVAGNTSDAILVAKVKAGSSLELDATASFDVDNDELFFNWFHYLEASDYPAQVEILNPQSAKPTVILPKDAKNHQIHIILELRDKSKYQDATFDYRRLILDCK